MYIYIVCSSWTEIHLDECVLNDVILIWNYLENQFLKKNAKRRSFKEMKIVGACTDERP